MNDNNFVFTSESVSEGHPDKVADQISDAILDQYLKEDPLSRVACETLVKNNTVVLAGEVTSQANINLESIVRKTINDIGYNFPEIGFDGNTCHIETFINEQSPDISQGVNENELDHKDQGAGDQGLMFGFACNETPELIPLPISLAHRLLKKLATDRKSKKDSFLRPDSKSQVTVSYNNGVPQYVDTVVISSQHSENTSLKNLKEYIIEEVVKKVIPSQFLSNQTKYFVNPTGRFVIGGPVGDCGLTGRKIIVDTYGGYSRHGGGAFSGKDPSKVDRSAAYAARHIAKNVVAAGLADKCEVQLAYAIGIAEPVSIFVDTFGTGKISDIQISNTLRSIFQLTPKGIIDNLNLLQPIYLPTATYGHFGRTEINDKFFSWEKEDKVDRLKEVL